MTKPYLLVGQAYQTRHSIEQLQIGIKTNLGVFGDPGQGIPSLTSHQKGDGSAIIQEDYWDSVIIDEAKQIGILVLHQKKSNVVLYIPDIYVKSTNKNNEMPFNTYGLNFMFDSEDIYVGSIADTKGILGLGPSKKNLQRADAILEEL